jgi:REP-associated tyrosine transposase
MLLYALASPLLLHMDELSLHEHHRVHQMLYHTLFCPKHRQKVLVGPVHDRLKRIIEQVAHQQCQMERVVIQPAPFCISAFDRR